VLFLNIDIKLSEDTPLIEIILFPTGAFIDSICEPFTIKVVEGISIFIV
jgi:hypothetical protein